MGTSRVLPSWAGASSRLASKVGNPAVAAGQLDRRVEDALFLQDHRFAVRAPIAGGPWSFTPNLGRDPHDFARPKRCNFDVPGDSDVREGNPVSEENMANARRVYEEGIAQGNCGVR